MGDGSLCFCFRLCVTNFEQLDTEYVSSSLSQTYLKTSKWSLKASVSMSVEDNLVTLTLVGPNNVWFSVGFGNKYMDGTYCVVVDGYGELSERYLIGKTAGDELDFTWTVVSNVESSHYRTVVLTREYDYELKSNYYHKFATSYSKLQTIWAYGKDAELDDHGNTRRGDHEIKASRTAVKSKTEDKEQAQEQEQAQENGKNKQLWGEVSTNVMEEEYSAYLTTSSIITWITCIIALMVIGWFIYQKWFKNSYNTIPDGCKSNINMVPMGDSHVAV